jgi:hypothetical protein
MQSAADAWRENLRVKLNQFFEALLLYLATKQKDAADEVSHKLAGLKMMFADNQILQPLRKFEGAFSQYRDNDHQPAFLRSVIDSYNELPSIANFSEAEPPSFDSIFESYKNDQELNKLVDELVALLQKILSEADDVLSAQIARELRIILDQLKKRERKSLYEVQSWIDLGVRTLIMVGETYAGTHGVTLIYEAVKIAYRIRRSLHDKYGEAEKRLIEEYKLTYVKKAIEHIPEIRSEEEGLKLLKAPEEPKDTSSQ